jgi:hypothetical protein
VRISVTIDGLGALLAAESRRIDAAVSEEVKAAGEGLKNDLRRQTEGLLGERVANAWRGKFYSNGGDAAKGPAGFVWTKAPRIIDFFSSAKVITPLGQAFAIPTENVPRGPRGRRLTPIEVEARFNAELRPVPLKGGRIGLVIDVIAALSKRRPGLRAATKGRAAQGRPTQPMLMFVLTRGPLRGRKLIDLDEFANRWGSKAAGNIEKRLERGIL